MFKEFFNKINKKKAKILIIGLGYVGYPLLSLIKSKKFKVSGLDLNKERIKKVLAKTIEEYQKFPQRNKSNELDSEIEYLKEQIEIQTKKTSLSSEKVQEFILDNRLTTLDNKLGNQKTSLLSQYGIEQNFNSPNGFETVFSIKSSLENELLKINYLIEEFDKIKSSPIYFLNLE